MDMQLHEGLQSREITVEMGESSLLLGPNDSMDSQINGSVASGLERELSPSDVEMSDTSKNSHDDPLETSSLASVLPFAVELTPVKQDRLSLDRTPVRSSPRIHSGRSPIPSPLGTPLQAKALFQSAAQSPSPEKTPKRSTQTKAVNDQMETPGISLLQFATPSRSNEDIIWQTPASGSQPDFLGAVGTTPTTEMMSRTSRNISSRRRSSVKPMLIDVREENMDEELEEEAIAAELLHEELLGINFEDAPSVVAAGVDVAATPSSDASSMSRENSIDIEGDEADPFISREKSHSSVLQQGHSVATISPRAMTSASIHQILEEARDGPEPNHQSGDITMQNPVDPNLVPPISRSSNSPKPEPTQSPSTSLETVKNDRLRSLSPADAEMLDDLVSPSGPSNRRMTPVYSTLSPDVSGAPRRPIFSGPFRPGKSALKKRLGRPEVSSATTSAKKDEDLESSSAFPAPGNHEVFVSDLAPLVKPENPGQLPFPFTTTIEDLALSSETPQKNPPPLVTTPKSLTKLPSQIPIATPVKNLHFPEAGSLKAPIASQLRQPSPLRTTGTGAASRIPRPGSKPYAKPASKLPKPKIPAPAPVPTTISSPVKTRRSRTVVPVAPKKDPTLVPPDVIVYPPLRSKRKEPPPPAATEPLPMDIDEPIRPFEEVLDNAIAAASPQGLRFKQATKSSIPPPSNLPTFPSNPPALQIFPVPPSRAKGRGKSAMKPSSMPSDAIALRQLTTSNTLRNQEYYSLVQTKVVMKDGARPPSPTTKVRTIVEKMKDDELKNRGERAARRAGRGGSLTTDDGDGRSETSEIPENRHPRGAGEDEDYETPVKQKRIRTESMQENDGDIKKRVKWDKNLLRRYEIEESDLEGLKRGIELAKARSAMKGCLSARVHLDPLGNVPEADVPITNLAKEQVVVTKLVYTDELPPAQRPKRAATTKAAGRGKTPNQS